MTKLQIKELTKRVAMTVQLILARRFRGKIVESRMRPIIIQVIIPTIEMRKPARARERTVKYAARKLPCRYQRNIRKGS